MGVHPRFKGSVLAWLNRQQRPTWAQEPGDFDPEAVERTVERVGRLLFGPKRPWQVQVEGLENVPASPVMVVSNHSGGTTILDAWGLGYAWYTHFGTGRPVHFLAHEWVLPFKGLGDALARRGVLWARRETALEALRCGHDVVVFPGGDLDAWRPYHRRAEVEFGGRTGYARLALQAGVPIVPLAHFGAHQTLRVLTDGRRLAQWLKLTHVARANVFPIHLSLPFGLTVGPWPHLPWPSRMRYRFGKPVVPPKRDPEAPISDEDVRELDAQVRERVGVQLRALAA